MKIQKMILMVIVMLGCGCFALDAIAKIYIVISGDLPFLKYSILNQSLILLLSLLGVLVIARKLFNLASK